MKQQAITISDDSDLNVLGLDKLDKAIPLTVTLASFGGGQVYRAINFTEALLDFKCVKFLVLGANVGTAFILLTAASEISAIDSPVFMYNGINQVSNAKTAREVELELNMLAKYERMLAEIMQPKWPKVNLESVKGKWLTVSDLNAMGIEIK